MRLSTLVDLFVSTILLLTVSACHKEDPRYEKTEEVVFAVMVYEGDLYDSGSSHLFYVLKDAKATHWVPFFNYVGDWGLEIGYEYKVSVWKHWLKEPSPYGNAIEYELREILSKKEAEPLTREDISLIVP